MSALVAMLARLGSGALARHGATARAAPGCATRQLLAAACGMRRARSPWLSTRPIRSRAENVVFVRFARRVAWRSAPRRGGPHLPLLRPLVRRGWSRRSGPLPRRLRCARHAAREPLRRMAPPAAADGGLATLRLIGCGDERIVLRRRRGRSSGLACSHHPADAGMSAKQRAAILRPTTQFDAPERWEELPGGSATNRARLDGDAFSQPSANLSFEQRADFFVGNGFFKRMWVTAPSSTEAADGLGPLYNARSCQGCHLKDGRGHPPEGPERQRACRCSCACRSRRRPRPSGQRWRAIAQAVVGEPTYGTQLQDLAIPGQIGEGRMAIAYEELPVELAGGETVQLRAAELRHRRPRLWPAAPRDHAEPARGAADDRAGPARGDRRGRSAGPGRPRRCRRRRHLRPAQPRLERDRGARGDGPLRLEGGAGPDRRAGRRRDGRRHRHRQPAGALSRRRLHAGADRVHRRRPTGATARFEIWKRPRR